MADIPAGNNFTMVSAAATTLIADRHCTLTSLTVTGTGNGTIILYDTPTAAGTAAGNAIGTFGLTASLGVMNTLPLNVNCSNGLAAAVTGTVLAGLAWQ